MGRLGSKLEPAYWDIGLTGAAVSLDFDAILDMLGIPEGCDAGVWLGIELTVLYWSIIAAAWVELVWLLTVDCCPLNPTFLKLFLEGLDEVWPVAMGVVAVMALAICLRFWPSTEAFFSPSLRFEDVESIWSFVEFYATCSDALELCGLSCIVALLAVGIPELYSDFLEAWLSPKPAAALYLTDTLPLFATTGGGTKGLCGTCFVVSSLAWWFASDALFLSVCFFSPPSSFSLTSDVNYLACSFSLDPWVVWHVFKGLFPSFLANGDVISTLIADGLV